MVAFKHRILLLGVSVLIGLGIKNYRKMFGPLPLPDNFDAHKYWGRGVPHDDDLKIHPFKIEYSQDKIELLKTRLTTNINELVDPLENTGFEYGFNLKYLKSVVNYWNSSYLTKFDDRLKYMNQFPQFKTQIQGLNIHFIHVTPPKTGKKIVPLLLLHGWPGSFIEFYEMIPLLLTGTDDIAFEVIAPSHPGYGFSDPAAKQGLSPTQVAIVLRNLMIRLGKDKFYIQGGDWGSFIGKSITTLFPSNVLGYHSNWCMVSTTLGIIKTQIANLAPNWFVDAKYHDWYFPASKRFIFLLKESGYFHIQATKPDTIGAALAHNPIGLAAYILEKFSTWTNPSFVELIDGGLEKYFTLDHLLDNIMM